MSDGTIPFRGIYNDPKVYRPLDTPSKEIRYLVIAPGSGEDSLVCSLGYTCLDASDRVQYEALSYTWGDLSQTVDISLQYPCDNRKKPPRYLEQKYRVTPNLYAALCNFRHQSKIRRIWTDAISINQADPVERTHQVGLMGHIYSMAKMVLVWLGEPDLFTTIAMRTVPIYIALDKFRDRLLDNDKSKETEDLLTYLEKLVKKGQQEFNSCESGESLDLHNGLKESQEYFFRALVFACMGDPELDLEICKALSLMDIPWSLESHEVQYEAIHWIIVQSANELVSRPWFRRTWVIQEVFLACQDFSTDSKATIHLGGIRLSWLDFCTFQRSLYFHKRSLNWIGYKNLTSNDTGDLDFFFATWHHMWFKPRHVGRDEVLELMRQTRPFLASEPRDKLFAMLSLASDTRTTFAENPLLRPDYTKSEARVLVDFAHWHICSSNSLKILNFAEPIEVDSTTATRPSWAPQLFHPSDEWPFAELESLHLEVEGSNTSDQPTAHFLFHDLSLCTYGVKVSQVQLVIPHALVCDDSVFYIERELNGENPELFGHLRRTYWDYHVEPSDSQFFQKCIRMFGCIESHRPNYNGFSEYMKPWFDLIYDEQDWDAFCRESNTRGSWEDEFMKTVKKFVKHRRLFFCEDKRWGVCPESAQEGDIVVALLSATFPLVLRPTSGDTFRLLGPCLFYDHRWEDGDVRRYQGENDPPLQTFRLV